LFVTFLFLNIVGAAKNNLGFPQLISLIGSRNNIPTLGSIPQYLLHTSEKRLRTHGKASGKMLLACLLDCQLALNSLLVGIRKFLMRLHIQQRSQSLVIYAAIPSPWILNLIETTPFPLARVIHNAGSDHIQIHIDKALPKMIAGLDGCGVVSILPECALSVFPLVVLLAGSAGNMLHGSGNGL
jgi:hypothetical protein